MNTLLSNIKAFFMNRNYIWMTDVTVATSVTNSDTIDMQTYSGGTIFLKSGTTSTITFYSSDADGSSYQAIKDSDSAIFSITINTSNPVIIPPGLFGAPYLRMVGDTAGSATVFLKG